MGQLNLAHFMVGQRDCNDTTG